MRRYSEIPQPSLDSDSSYALINPVTVQEARALHKRMMNYIFTSKYVPTSNECAVSPTSGTNFNQRRHL